MRIPCDFGWRCEPIEDMSGFTDDIAGWLKKQATSNPTMWLLAYAEDGVIWGKLEKSALLLPAKYAPPLHPLTLLEARLFGEASEMHVWKAGDQFQACRVVDTPQAGGGYDEYLRLWGTERVGTEGGFTILNEGREGLQQVVPLEIPAHLFSKQHPRFHPTLLQTRHYFGYDPETGAAAVVMSRLVGLETETRHEYRKREERYE